MTRGGRRALRRRSAVALLGSAAAQEGPHRRVARLRRQPRGATLFAARPDQRAATSRTLKIAWRWYARQLRPDAGDEERDDAADDRRRAVRDGGRHAQRRRDRRRRAARRCGSGGRTTASVSARRRASTSGRGVAYWSDGADERACSTVTPGFYLVVARCRHGLAVREFGEAGVVDLRRGLRGPMDNVEAGSSSPPLVVGDVVIVGPARGVGARPNAKTQVKLDVRGFDVRTGKLLWTFHTIPEKRRVRLRHLAHAGLGRVHGQRGRVGADVGRPRARARLSARRRRRRATSTAASGTATTCSATASSRSTRRPASASGTSSSSITTSGTGTTRRRRSCSTSPSTAGPSKPSCSSRSRRSRTRSIA